MRTTNFIQLNDHIDKIKNFISTLESKMANLSALADSFFMNFASALDEQPNVLQPDKENISEQMEHFFHNPVKTETESSYTSNEYYVQNANKGHKEKRQAMMSVYER